MEKHWKNLFGVSGTVLFSLGSFMVSAGMQSSIHQYGIGVAALSIFQLSQAISSLFAPIFTAKVGTKWSMVFGTLCWCILNLCNFYPKSYVYLPASMLVGIAISPFWVAEPTHVTTTAFHLASITGEKSENLVSRFTGICFWFQKFSTIPGYLISSFVLHSASDKSTIDLTDNGTFSHCGAAMTCDPPDASVLNQTNRTPSSYNLTLNFNMLFGVLLGCCCIGVILSIFCIDPLPSFCDIGTQQKCEFRILALRALRMIRNRHFILLIPVIALNGLELSFYFGTFTKVREFFSALCSNRMTSHRCDPI